MIEVKPLLAHEWPILKTVRLRALTNTPDAFATTLAQVQDYTDGDWQDRANRFAVNLSAAARIAYLDSTPCGMMTYYLAETDLQDEKRMAELIAVWIDLAVHG